MKFKINPQSFNAVMACAAVEDVRYYLNTFFIDTTNNRMVATNGHVLAYAPVERVDDGGIDAEPDKHMGDLQGFLFQALKRPISNKGNDVFIDCARNSLGYHRTVKSFEETQLEVCNAKYVDYTRVVYDDKHKAIGSIAFNAEYVARPARWAGFDYALATFQFNGDRNAIGVTYPKDLPDVQITLMPGRIR